MAKVGNIYFAYVDPLDVFDDSIHNVEDEDVFSLKIMQSEGEFARAEVEVINPGEGLLNPARQQFVFISADYNGSIELLFAGRITTFPLNFGNETVVLELIAQPDDWFNTQSTFLDTLKVAPFFSKLYIPEDRRDEPSEILAARGALLNWNRSTGAVNITDIVEGGTTIDLEDNFFFDSLQSDIGDPPLESVKIDIEVQWNQIGLGVVNCHDTITAEFSNSVTTSPVINTLTPIAFEQGWSGVRIPSGYTLIETKLSPIADGFGIAQADLRSSAITVAGANYPTKTGATPPTREVTVPRVFYEGLLFLQAEYQQKRRELMSTTVSVATQGISLTSEREEVLALTLQDPTAPAQDEVLDIGAASFFYDDPNISTPGAEAIEHAILRAMARLKKGARVVEVQFECELGPVLDITCDHNVRIEDDRLPGGSVLGKVLGYDLNIEGDGGSQFATIRIGCTVGTGANSSGTGTAVGTESYTNEHGVPATMQSEVFYELGSTPTISQPVDVAQMEADEEHLVISATVTNDGETQNTNVTSEAFPDQYLEANQTEIEVELTSMNPEPELFADIDITSSTLTLPRQIDLEA